MTTPQERSRLPFRIIIVPDERGKLKTSAAFSQQMLDAALDQLPQYVVVTPPEGEVKIVRGYDLRTAKRIGKEGCEQYIALQEILFLHRGDPHTDIQPTDRPMFDNIGTVRKRPYRRGATKRPN